MIHLDTLCTIIFEIILSKVVKKKRIVYFATRESMDLMLPRCPNRDCATKVDVPKRSERRHRAQSRFRQGGHQIYALQCLQIYFLREMGTFPPDLFPYLVSYFLFGLMLPLGRIRFHILPWESQNVMLPISNGLRA